MTDGHIGLVLNGRRPFGAGLNGLVGHLRQVMSPGLKLPTQSQMANGNLKVPDLKVCIQNVKFIVFHMNFGIFLKKIFLKKFFSCHKENFLVVEKTFLSEKNFSQKKILKKTILKFCWKKMFCKE